jgi:hypothetical protein
MNNAPTRPETLQPTDPRELAAKHRRHAEVLESTGAFDFAIEHYKYAIALTLGDVDLHQALRETGLRRKAAGGNAAGLLTRWKAWREKDPVAALVLRAHVLAYDPGNPDALVAALHAAHRIGLPDVERWISFILRESQTPE